jgi:site-specific recombinase XerD
MLKYETAKNLMRVKKTPLDAVTSVDFETSLKFADTLNRNSYLRARDRVSLLLLYISGMNVSNLSLIKVMHIKNLLSNKSVTIAPIKGKLPKGLQITSFDFSKRLIKAQMEDLHILIQGKADNELIITSKKRKTALCRETITRRINVILKLVGKQSNRELLSHSFRIALTAELIHSLGILDAKSVMGHSDLRTTLSYYPEPLAEAFMRYSRSVKARLHSVKAKLHRQESSNWPR